MTDAFELQSLAIAREAIVSSLAHAIRSAQKLQLQQMLQ